MKLLASIVMLFSFVTQQICCMEKNDASPLVSATEYRDPEKNIRVLLYGFLNTDNIFDQAYTQALQSKFLQSEQNVTFFIHGGPSKKSCPVRYEKIKNCFLVSLFNDIPTDKKSLITNIDAAKECLLALEEAGSNVITDNTETIEDDPATYIFHCHCNYLLDSMCDKLFKKNKSYSFYFKEGLAERIRKLHKILRKHKVSGAPLNRWSGTYQEKECLSEIKSELCLFFNEFDALTVFTAIVCSEPDSTIVFLYDHDNQKSAGVLGDWLYSLGYAYVNHIDALLGKAIPSVALDWVDVPQKICSVCFKHDAGKHCSVCLRRYCSKVCQKSDWPSHKAQCKSRLTFSDIINASSEKLEALGYGEDLRKRLCWLLDT